MRHLRRVLRVAPSAVLFGLLGLLIVYPLGLLAYASIVDQPPRPGEPRGSFTAENYVNLALPGSIDAIRNSLIIGVAGTLLAVAIGCSLAWIAARSDVPMRWLVQLSAIAPIFVSPFVGALAWSMLASPRAGYLNVMMRDVGVPFGVDVYSLAGIIFVSGIYHAPLAFLFLYSALALMNPELEDAARIHGSGGWGVIRHVTFGLAKPALLSASTLVLVLIVENFTIPEILGTPAAITVVPAQIYRLMSENPSKPNDASAFAMALLGFLVILVFLQNRLLRGRDYTTVGGKGFLPRTIHLGAWRWLAFAFTLLYLLVGTLLPLWALVMGAVSSTGFFINTRAFIDLGSMTLDNFTQTLDSPTFQQALRNTSIVVIATAMFGGALHYLVAHVVHRSHVPGRRLMGYIAVAPVAIPGIVIGLGYLWGWIILPVPIYGTLVILVLAYSARMMPFGFRTISSTIGQVHSELEESAYVLGASKSRAAMSITFPLIRPGVISMVLLLVVLAFQEFSLSLFLFKPSTEVLTITLFHAWAQGETATVAVISLTIAAILFAVALVGRRWLRVSRTLLEQ